MHHTLSIIAQNFNLNIHDVCDFAEKYKEKYSVIIDKKDRKLSTISTSFVDNFLKDFKSYDEELQRELDKIRLEDQYNG